MEVLATKYCSDLRILVHALRDTKAPTVKRSNLLANHLPVKTVAPVPTSMEDSPMNVPALSDMKALTVKLSSFHANQTHVRMEARALTTWMQLTPAHVTKVTKVVTAKLIALAVATWPNAYPLCPTLVATTKMQKPTVNHKDGIWLTLKTVPNITS